MAWVGGSTIVGPQPLTSRINNRLSGGKMVLDIFISMTFVVSFQEKFVSYCSCRRGFVPEEMLKIG